MSAESNSAFELMDTEQVAKYLRVSRATLDTWRSRGGGPEFCKVGRAVRYPVEAINRYVLTRMYKSTSARAQLTRVTPRDTVNA